MRLRWPEDSRLTLNGEVDKRAHPIFRGLVVANTIPDFLVHVPGSMEGNHAIIEVKSVSPSPGAIRRDLEKINQFRTEVGYQRGIYLIFGGGAENDVVRIAREAACLDPQGAIEVWLHVAPNEVARRVTNQG